MVGKHKKGKKGGRLNMKYRQSVTGLDLFKDQTKTEAPDFDQTNMLSEL